MKKLILVSLVLCFALFSNAKEIVIKYENGQIKYKYNYVAGAFDGKLQAWFSNGQKKIEGQYEHNFKVDTWTYWNEKGEVIWERTFYDILKESEKPESDRNTAMLEYNNKSFTNFYKIEGKIETWGKMSLSFLRTSEQNQVLFENDRLYNLIIENIKSKRLIAYKRDSNMDEIYVFEELEDRLKELTATPDCFEIKEESRFNKDKDLIETKIIGISPMLKNRDGHLVRLCSVYFPNLIPVMTKDSSKNNDMVDLFLKREFDNELLQHGSIYTKEPLPETKEEYKTKAEIEIEDQQSEIEFLEMNYKSALFRSK